MSRFLTGFFQVFISIYWPVWTDAFSPSDSKKTAWMSAFLLSSPLGVLFGYVLTTQLIQHYSWEDAFYVQAAAVVPAILLTLVLPSKYLALHGGKEDAARGAARQVTAVDGSQSAEETARGRSQRNAMLGQSFDSEQLNDVFSSSVTGDMQGTVTHYRELS